MPQITKYLDFLAALEKNNQHHDLDGTDVSLLNFITKASGENRLLNVKDLLALKDIASQATIHGRLKMLEDKNLIELKANSIDGRLKEVALTKLGRKRNELLSQVIEKTS